MGIRLYLILLLNIGPILCAEWENPAATKPECTETNENSCIKFWQFNPDELFKSVFVHFNEEQEKSFVIANIHCKDCSLEDLQFGSFETGSIVILNPELTETETGTFSLIIKNKLDYEVVEQRDFTFNIVLQETNNMMITIKVLDIDDNPPRVILDKIPCIIEENYNGLTDCTMSIFDPDEVNNVHQIQFELPDNIEQHFKVNLDPVNNTHATGTLEVTKKLDFETMPVYYFDVTAIDGGGNHGDAPVMIKVKDMNDEPPRWVEIFAMKSFKEHEDQLFTIYAIDGDLELNETITYEILCPEKFNINLKHNESNDAMDIIVIDIDREDPDVENNSNTITCKLLANDSLFTERTEINFIIEDINDNKPFIDLYNGNKEPIQLKEERYASLDKLFSVDDKDLGNNAQFDVTLQNSNGEPLKVDFTKPFQVIPNNGYRNWDFSVSVSDPEILDYDKDPTWRDFSIIIHSEDKGEGPLYDNKEIKIQLINLNDEIPKFQPIDEVNIKETAGNNTYILNVLAIDDDFNDTVEYSLQDNDYTLKDHPKNGSVTIYTSRENIFDYEKIKTVYIQIKATDTLEDEEDNRNSVTQEIKINVIDVNDETPRIFLPFSTIEIKEHSEVHTEVIVSEDIAITAEDVDTEALLKFSILWDKCRASKLGVPIDIEDIEDVFIIETRYPNEQETKQTCSNPNLAITGCAQGVLKVNNNKTLDYEKFDTILLSIQVEDENQVENTRTDEGMMTITLVDINDNAPEFVESTINSVKKVVEHADNDISIGTIKAIDIDGPEFNNVTYYLTPIDDTKADLIYIDVISGELIVKNGIEIDADYPDYVKYLNYTVIANDSEYRTAADIQIEVKDINDEYPFLIKELPKKLTVAEEKKECFDIDTIEGHDYDRDDPHNTVRYFINDDFSDLHQMFRINSETGEICVHGNIQWSIDKTQIQFYFTLQDNLGAEPNIEKFNFTIFILDVDNNAPVLPKKPSDMQRIDENTKKEEPIFQIIATDKDEPCTIRTKIDYKITKILNSKDEEIKDKIFEITYKEGPKPNCQQIGQVIVNKDLNDYYGTFTITIHAQNPDTEKNFDEENYEINVEPFNFKSPAILSPSQTLFVLKNKQTPGEKLKTLENSDINDFEATDNQNGKFEMIFSLQGDDSIFELLTKPVVDKNKARLTVKVKEPNGEYDLEIKANHNGTGSADRSVVKKIKVKFVDDNLLPVFINNSASVNFWENNTSERCKNIPPANDPKCDSVDCLYKVYYHILTSEEKDIFTINRDDPKQPQICLLQDLDREERECHYLNIFASNYENPPTKPPANSQKSLLKLTVKVDDVNDNPPSFSRKLFKGSLSDTYKIETVIVTLIATDPDTVDKVELWYAINKKTINVSDTSLESIKNNAFQIKENKIVNLFTPSQKMSGHFTIDVNVYDSYNYTDEAVVKIHIISDKIRLSFKFDEDIDTVKSKGKEIEDIFTKTFGYACTIDDYTKKSNNTATTKANSFITEIKTYFVDVQDEPVEKDKITVKLEDLALVGKLRFRFDDIGLTLIDVDEGTTVIDEVEDLNYLLQILLIIVSVVLGTLCLILIVAFILRTRSLKRRLDAMTTNVFGSTKSDLNRVGINAPGTNRHAIEANPVWNEDLNNVNQFDAMSQTSGGSDLIGVEDQPDFEYDYRRASINPVVQQMFDKNEDHVNGFVVGSNNMKKRSNDDDDEINSLPDSLNKSSMF